jgi:hypothetical protein
VLILTQDRGIVLFAEREIGSEIILGTRDITPR